MVVLVSCVIGLFNEFNEEEALNAYVTEVNRDCSSGAGTRESFLIENSSLKAIDEVRVWPGNKTGWTGEWQIIASFNVVAHRTKGGQN